MSSLKDSYVGLTRPEHLNKYTLYDQPGNIPFLMRGLLLDANPSTPQTVWNQGGDYVYLNSDTLLYLSSTSASDTDVDIQILGMNDQLELMSATQTLNGQNQVLVDSFYRVFDIRGVRGSLVGEVFLAESDTLSGGEPNDSDKIHAKISLGSTAGETGEYASDHSSHNGFYTVPAGYELHLISVLGTSTGAEGSLTYRLKIPGYPWWNRNPLPITANRIEEIFEPTIILPAGTEVQARALGGNNQSVSTRAQGWLVPVAIQS